MLCSCVGNVVIVSVTRLVWFSACTCAAVGGVRSGAEGRAARAGFSRASNAASQHTSTADLVCVRICGARRNSRAAWFLPPGELRSALHDCALQSDLSSPVQGLHFLSLVPAASPSGAWHHISNHVTLTPKHHGKEVHFHAPSP